MDVLFKTVHGSRLYNLAKPGSDYDYFTVIDKPAGNRRAKYARQSIVDSEDSLVVDFGTFMEGCVKGVPQFCEAMMSNMAEIDRIAALRAGYRFGSGVFDTYLRTIKSFTFSEKDAYKRKRHALRLALNMHDIRRSGRFNPTLTAVQVELISTLAELSAEYVYNDALAIAWG